MTYIGVAYIRSEAPLCILSSSFIGQSIYIRDGVSNVVIFALRCCGILYKDSVWGIAHFVQQQVSDCDNLVVWYDSGVVNRWLFDPVQGY